jgi:hypothetical protein
MFMFTLKPAAKADPVVRFETGLFKRLPANLIKAATMNPLGF